MMRPMAAANAIDVVRLTSAFLYYATDVVS